VRGGRVIAISFTQCIPCSGITGGSRPPPRRMGIAAPGPGLRWATRSSTDLRGRTGARDDPPRRAGARDNRARNRS